MPSSQAALVRRALTWLTENGVREVCVAAGARNAPLIGALAKSSGVTLRHFFEERSAGFFALGRVMATQRPVAVVTTSGTAAAELLPAMIEAHYQGLPLVAVTADRPKLYRGTGAPQAIEQAALFEPYAGLTLDVDASTDASDWLQSAAPSQPFHLNVCLEEPLDPEIEGVGFASLGGAFGDRARTPEFDLGELIAWLSRHERTMVAVAGLHPTEAALLTPLLLRLGLPIFAEATANLSGTPQLRPLLIPPAEQSIRALAPTAVLRIGAVPSGRWWRDLEAPSKVAVLSLSKTGHSGLARQTNVQSGVFDFAQDIDSCDFPHTGTASVPPLPRPTFDQPSPHSNEKAWLNEIAMVIPDNALVFLGNSLPIREWNETVGNSRPLRTFANRGANGIDGLVSTFLGLSADETSSESWLILGDLSALYDLAAPWILSQLPAANRRIVVLNNGGGRIFSKVKSLQHLAVGTRAMIENPHQLSFRPWAELWSIPHRLIGKPTDLRNLPQGHLVIEVPTQP